MPIFDLKGAVQNGGFSCGKDAGLQRKRSGWQRPKNGMMN
jgi:hypothetical protein